MPLKGVFFKCLNSSESFDRLTTADGAASFIAGLTDLCRLCYIICFCAVGELCRLAASLQI